MNFADSPSVTDVVTASMLTSGWSSGRPVVIRASSEGGPSSKSLNAITRTVYSVSSASPVMRVAVTVTVLLRLVE